METPERARFCQRRGRPRINQSLEGSPSPRCYAPQCYPNEEAERISILPEQMAVLNLIDVQGLSQEEAAAVLGISRKTVWHDIHETRRRIVDALVNGKPIEISGCEREFRGFCPQRNCKKCPRENQGICPRTALPPRSESDKNAKDPE